MGGGVLVCVHTHLSAFISLTRSPSANLTAMINGGGPTMVYGFLFAVFGSLTTAASLAEMASMAPTSGGQYHWVSMLAPEKYKVFLSWITGMTYSFSFSPSIYLTSKIQF